MNIQQGGGTSANNLSPKEEAARHDSLMREQVGCPSCHAVAATWITDCPNPIHAEQANAYIRKLEQHNAALRTQLAQATALLAALPAGAEATLRKWYTEKTRAEQAEQQLVEVTAELKKHLSGDYSDDPVDGIRQLAQAMISNRDNCQTLEQQLAEQAATIARLEEHQKLHDRVFARQKLLMDEQQVRVTELEAALKDVCGWVLAFDNGKRKHFRDPLTGFCTDVCQACAITQTKHCLAALKGEE